MARNGDSRQDAAAEAPYWYTVKWEPPTTVADFARSADSVIVGTVQLGKVTFVYFSLKKMVWAAGRQLAVQQGVNYCGIATDDRTPRAVAPFAIGATVFAGALVTGPLTGGSFNPARSFGPALLSRNWSGHWLYWFAPVLGMVLAMRLYDQLRPSSGDGDGAARVLTGTEGPL